MIKLAGNHACGFAIGKYLVLNAPDAQIHDNGPYTIQVHRTPREQRTSGCAEAVVSIQQGDSAGADVPDGQFNILAGFNGHDAGQWCADWNFDTEMIATLKPSQGTRIGKQERAALIEDVRRCMSADVKLYADAINLGIKIYSRSLDQSLVEAFIRSGIDNDTFLIAVNIEQGGDDRTAFLFKTHVNQCVLHHKRAQDGSDAQRGSHKEWIVSIASHVLKPVNQEGNNSTVYPGSKLPFLKVLP